MKRIVYNMIEQGYNNADIAKALDLSPSQVCNMRSEFNKFSPIKYRSIQSKRAKLEEPKAGTMSHKIYTLIKSGVTKTADIKAATGAACGVIHSVRKKFFDHKPRDPKTTMKAAIIKMIKKGFQNKDIKSAIGCSLAHIVKCRSDFNKGSPVKFKSRKPKQVGPSIPKEGTMSRAVYDLIKQGVGDINTIIAATGAPHGVIHSVRIKFFGYKPKQPTYQRYNAMRTIELSELRP